MTFFTSDWHLIKESEEDADRDLIFQFMSHTRPSNEIILGGDIFDRTRAKSDDAIKFISDIMKEYNHNYFTFIWGNHEGTTKDMNKIARRLYELGVDASTFQFTSTPVLRGKFICMHGHVFDEWCSKHGSFRTTMGEAFTKLDYLVDKTRIDLEKLNPRDWYKRRGSKEFDHPIHMRANHWAAGGKFNLIYGHSHVAYELTGTDWSVYNSGSLTKDSKSLTFVKFDDSSATLIEVNRG